MLPASPAIPDGQRRLHRRQNSTPSAAQGQRFSPYPSFQQRRGAGHRRGMSLDVRQLQTTSSAARQEYLAKSNTNHAGLDAIPQHYVLREAQQQRQQASPGSQQPPYTTNLTHSLSDSGFLLSPQMPRSPSFGPSCLDPDTMFSAFMSNNANAMAQNSQIDFSQPDQFDLGQNSQFNLGQSGQVNMGPSTPTLSTFPNHETFSGTQMKSSANMGTPEASLETFDNQQNCGNGLSFGPQLVTPSTPHQTHFTASFEKPQGSGQITPQSGGESQTQTPCRRNSPHRRTESEASMASAASISNINLEEAKTDTGITMSDIAEHIEHNIHDGTWSCKFQGCGRPFNRKENIKSHVQTHLNDRPYLCQSCKKRFVRSHDLKRHAKIHTGVKPYPCGCGNSFARHDALTRHRQRGMCIGALDGVVKKHAKRGRPRKPRPDIEERREKSDKTRQKNLSTSSVSSQSNYTDTSAATTPGDDANLLDDVLDLAAATETQQENDGAASSAPMPNFNGQAVSAGEAPVSPSVASQYSYVSPQALMDHSSPHHVSPYHTPGTSHEGSVPPGLSSPRHSQEPEAFFSADLDASSAEVPPNLTASSSIVTSASLDEFLPSDYDAQDYSFLDFTGSGNVPPMNDDDDKFGDLLQEQGLYGSNDDGNDFFSDFDSPSRR